MARRGARLDRRDLVDRELERAPAGSARTARARPGIDHVCQLAADRARRERRARQLASGPGSSTPTSWGSSPRAARCSTTTSRTCRSRRVGTVDDIAAMARFLVGPESTWITGQAIGVDGGHSLTRGPSYRVDPRAALRRRRPPRHRRQTLRRPAPGGIAARPGDWDGTQACAMSSERVHCPLSHPYGG